LFGVSTLETVWGFRLEEGFEARLEGYADLGLEALSIADALRGTFKLPKLTIAIGNADWDSEQFLRDKKLNFRPAKP
jgi:hypothetical protein